MAKFEYVDNTGASRDYHDVIMAAIANGCIFGEDFEDVFVLTKTPEGSAAEYALNFA